MTMLPDKAPHMFGATRVGQRAVILFGDGTRNKRTATYLGSGRFTTAFRIEDEVILYTYFEDFSKSILAQAKRLRPRNRHIPIINRIGTLHYKERRCNVYKACYYRPIEKDSISENTRAVISALQEAHDKAATMFPHDVVRTYECSDFNRVIIEAEDIPILLRSALGVIAESAEDWGDHYLFDNFHQRNLGLDSLGNLVLLDPLFDYEKIRDDFRARRKKGL